MMSCKVAATPRPCHDFTYLQLCVDKNGNTSGSYGIGILVTLLRPSMQTVMHTDVSGRGHQATG